MKEQKSDLPANIQIHIPSILRTGVTLPSSKSISNRALLISSLANEGKAPEEAVSKVHHISDCDDSAVMVQTVSHLEEMVNVGAAGTAMRFLTAFISTIPGCRTITGSARMLQRPIAPLVQALKDMGADISYMQQEGFPPLRINGCTLRGGRVEMRGNVSSQFISALLMIAPKLRQGLTLHLTGDIISRPYINMTLKMMADFGALAAWTAEDEIRVEPTGYVPREYDVESDWSASSYWFEMVAVSKDSDAEVTLRGLCQESMQGDAVVKDIFRSLGVSATFKNDGSLKLRKEGKPVDCFHYDFVNCPDLAQTFVVTCALLGTHFHLTGLQSLKIKETDRIEALKTELRKLGFVVTSKNDSELHWEGERCPVDKNPAIDTYEDHRMAMSFAPAAVLFPGLVINNPRVVRKSYPHFWEEVFQVAVSNPQQEKA